MLIKQFLQPHANVTAYVAFWELFQNFQMVSYNIVFEFVITNQKYQR